MKASRVKTAKTKMKHDSYLDEARSWLQLGVLNNAAEACRKELTRSPTSLEACELLCGLLMQSKQFHEAESLLCKSLSHHESHPWIHYALGNCQLEMENFEAAIGFYNAAIELVPKFGDAHYNCGNAYKGMGSYEEAINCYRHATVCNPGDVDALLNTGLCYILLRRFTEAVQWFQKAVDQNPLNSEALNNLGGALNELKQYNQALDCLHRALNLQSQSGHLMLNLGNSYLGLKNFKEAEKFFQISVNAMPNDPKCHIGLGLALKAQGLIEEAIRCYAKAIQLDPGYPVAHFNLGNAYIEQRRYPEAIMHYVEAKKLNGNFDYLSGIVLNAQMQMCDWSQWHEQKLNITKGVEKGEAVTSPFTLLAITDSGNLNLKASKIWASHKYSTCDDEGLILDVVPKPKIRIGYFSSDFWAHATAQLMVELIELHNRKDFEVIGFSYGENKRDEMRARLENAFDELLNDDQIIDLSKSKELDIAIDLKGYTKDTKFNLFANRLAPVQISFLGYPGTTAAPFIDYLIADQFIIPKEYTDFYTEKIIWMPDCYQINQHWAAVKQIAPDRKKYGLPNEAFIFASFNNDYKITPTWFDLWMRILTRVENAVLWVFEDNQWVPTNLRREAEARGVSGNRIFFAPRLPREEHLIRQKCADLFLDTFPYNAHTTASDALRYGLPIITCTGESFASRVASSLLHAVDLPEMVVDSPREYEDLAVDLATVNGRLANIKIKLANNLEKSKLFDVENYVSNFEVALRAVSWRRQNNRGFDHWEGLQNNYKN